MMQRRLNSVLADLCAHVRRELAAVPAARVPLAPGAAGDLLLGRPAAGSFRGQVPGALRAELRPAGPRAPAPRGLPPPTPRRCCTQPAVAPQMHKPLLPTQSAALRNLWLRTSACGPSSLMTTGAAAASAERRPACSWVGSELQAARWQPRLRKFQPCGRLHGHVPHATALAAASELPTQAFSTELAPKSICTALAAACEQLRHSLTRRMAHAAHTCTSP